MHLRQILEEERRPFSTHSFVNIALIIAFSVVALLVKGGNSFESIIGL